MMGIGSMHYGMVPKLQEPMLIIKPLGFTINKCTFALQKQNTKINTTMKKNNTQTISNNVSKTTKSKKQKVNRKQTEANAHRKVAKSWAFLAHGVKYQKAATKESCQRTTKQMEAELFDGILLNLRDKNSIKSYSEQKRILRRIVEKRQAQQARHNVGRSKDRFTSHMLRQCASKSMSELKRYQLCA